MSIRTTHSMNEDVENCQNLSSQAKRCLADRLVRGISCVIAHLQKHTYAVKGQAGNRNQHDPLKNVNSCWRFDL